MNYPGKIASILGDRAGICDNIGMSHASVMVFDDCVLKVTPISDNTDTILKTMKWLEGKVPAARIICHEETDGMCWLLMSKVPGTMACDRRWLNDPHRLMSALAEGLHLLWQTDTTGCPRKITVDDLLEEAAQRVADGDVDFENMEPETFGENGFNDCCELLSWLQENKPESVLKLAHGDHCLPNVFIDNGHFSGYIDLDDIGIGEMWRDIALCYRSLKHNCDGHFGVVCPMEPDKLFAYLGIEPDEAQLRWHLLLDELL